MILPLLTVAVPPSLDLVWFRRFLVMIQTLPVPPRFVFSLDGVLTPNLNTSLFLQQDKLIAFWLLSTISSSLLSSFIAGKLACEVWSTTNRLFATATRAKLSHIKNELHSIEKEVMLVKQYVTKIQNTCALLEASRYVVPGAKKKAIDVLLKFESRQARTVTEMPFHAHLVEAAPMTPVCVVIVLLLLHMGMAFRLGFSVKFVVDMEIRSNDIITSSIETMVAPLLWL
ncbi:hypothetical protein J1N35_037991 [Gossypium stocksii]|uniref:Uncharacterized protein n=1 Tax=Gossypium stocksii TaxID=47602 RepID=A0A9D3ZMA3_9ROSI|nr:hypothetical protein J1N35_037991 [Gossypium stocksii]